MLKLVKHEDITHEIFLDNNEISELRTLKLPEDWWHTTISHDLEKSKHKLKLLKFDQQQKKKNLYPALPKSDCWDVRKGDYRVKESASHPTRLDPELKKLIAFTHFSLTLVLTVGTVVLILSQIAKI